MAAHGSHESNEALIGGTIGGLVAGAAIAAVSTALSFRNGQDIWIGAKTAAIPFIGDAALQPGFDAGAVILGLLCHFGVSMGWGILFALLAYGLSSGATVAAGVGWGIVVWVCMYYVVLSLVGAAKLVAMASMGTAVFEHLLFGFVLGICFLPFQRHRLAHLGAPAAAHI